ncbi:tripartite tricarboxylate transporter substrate binding protein [Allopusillimonas ginsengisoli]|uniref:tripartite tricarboxylate transporter substrate binding protein n=1 Tax=Allopusillimonas ginsengisoli TaxID=453575 RepID=UPI0039C1CCCF
MKHLLIQGMLAISLTASVSVAQAAWPNDKPIEVIVGFSPGGGTDVMARLIARFAEKRLPDARFVVVNKPGAGGTIAFAAIARAAPDGYTIGMINAPGFNFLPLYKPTQYKPEDLRLIARVVEDPIVIYAKRDSDVPKSLSGIVEALKEKPESLSFGYSGDGTVGHIGLMQMEQLAEFEANAIPFKGGADSRSALIGGHISYALLTTGEVPDATSADSPFIAVAQLAQNRSENFDTVPTANEEGVDVSIASERGFAAPKDTPPEITKRLEALLKEILKDPEFVAAATADAPVLAFEPGDEWAAQLKKDTNALRPLAAKLKQ